VNIQVDTIGWQKKFVEQNFEVHAMDHQGHGFSEGDRGYVEQFDHFVSDFIQFISITIDDRKIPNFLLGHSLGGTIAFFIANSTEDIWNAVAFSAPAIVVDPQIEKPYLVAISGFISHYFPKLEVPSSVPPNGVNRDPEIAQLYASGDPLIYRGKIRARLGYESLKAFKKIETEILSTFKLPFLILHGTHDKITSVEGSKLVYEKSVQSSIKKIKIYEGYYHGLLNEPLEERLKVFEDILAWFKDNMIKRKN